MGMATINNSKDLAGRIFLEFGSRYIDRILLFGSVATKGTGNDIDIVVILKNTEVSNQSSLYHDIYRRVVSPFIKQELIGVDLFVWDFMNVVRHNREGSPFLKLIQREGRVLYMSKEYLEEWFKVAKEDYEMAGILLVNGYYRGSCIHSQQAIEKCLKGMLIKDKWELERTHNIEVLVAITIKRNVSIKMKDDDIEFLDSIYRGRYPAEEGLLPAGEPDKEAAIRALEIAANVLMQSKEYSNLDKAEHFINQDLHMRE